MYSFREQTKLTQSYANLAKKQLFHTFARLCKGRFTGKIPTNRYWCELILELPLQQI